MQQVRKSISDNKNGANIMKVWEAALGILVMQFVIWLPVFLPEYVVIWVALPALAVYMLSPKIRACITEYIKGDNNDKF